MHKVTGWRILLAGTVTVITALSLTPHVAVMPDGPQMDKLAHLAAYVTLAFLVDAGWPGHRFGPAKWLPLLAYGLLIELLQTLIPNRMFSLADLAANATGILIYAVLLMPLARRWRLTVAPGPNPTQRSDS